jgi:hypothetical protein
MAVAALLPGLGLDPRAPCAQTALRAAVVVAALARAADILSRSEAKSKYCNMLQTEFRVFCS